MTDPSDDPSDPAPSRRDPGAGRVQIRPRVRTVGARGQTTPARGPESRGLAANVWKSWVYAILMDLSLSAPIWVLYLRDQRGFSLTQITFLEVPLFLLIVLAEVPTGAIADRFGRRVSLVLASAILGPALLVYATATSYALILISNLAWGLAYTFRSGADTALLWDSLQQVGRETDFQRLNGRLWALRSAAMLAGLLLGAPIAAATSYSTAISLAALLHGGGALVALSMREPRAAQTMVTAEPYLRTLTAGAQEAWREPTLRYVFLYSAVVAAGAAGPLVLLQQPWLAQHGVATARLGLWQAPAYATEVLSALAAGWVLARLGERRAFFALPLMLSLFGSALVAVDHVWIAPAFLGIALVRGLHQPVLAGYVNRRVESRRRATVLSVQSMVGNVAMATAWPAAGAIADALGLRAAFLMYAAGTLALGAGALLPWDRARRARA